MPELLEFANLTHKRDAKVPTLSGGMKRRLTLARALVNDPDVIFLDEPTTGLDPQARHLIWQRLRELTARGKTLLLTTHFMDEAERLCHRLAVMDNGRIISAGSPRELIAQNIEPQVVEVFGEQAAAWAQDHAAQHAQRFEVSGESVFCYVNDAQPLLHGIAAASGTALPAPAGQPGRCVPETDRPGDARMNLIFRMLYVFDPVAVPRAARHRQFAEPAQLARAAERSGHQFPHEQRPLPDHLRPQPGGPVHPHRTAESHVQAQLDTGDRRAHDDLQEAAGAVRALRRGCWK